MRPMPGVRLTLIAKEIEAPYSGMLPGLVAGHYTYDECHIDLLRLANFAGARVIHGLADHIDPIARRVSISGRPSLAFDLLSIDVGSVARSNDLPGAAEFALPFKPISSFWPLWSTLERRMGQSDRPRNIVFIGGGAAGFEMVLAAAHRLKQICPADMPKLTLVAGRVLLPTLNARVRNTAKKSLRGACVELIEGDRVTDVSKTAVTLASGRVLPCEQALYSTSAMAPQWLGQTDLETDDVGFLLTRTTLQTSKHDHIFAVGDCATISKHPRPKAGVFAVRQGPVLAENLRRMLRGDPLKRYHPQRKYLNLLSTGDGRAIAAREGFSARGSWVWRWKDHIDRRFMKRFQALPSMGDMDDEEMRCGGCASKVGPATLTAALDRVEDDRSQDDAAIVDDGGPELRLETVDFFRAFWSDPYVFGEVAAHHALSDIYAMGGEPNTAQAICVLPYARPQIVSEDLYQLMEGARAAFAAANVKIIGGHTTEASETAVGFAVSGSVRRDGILRKSGMSVGDALILTKPIGTGILFAAAMRNKASAPEVFGVLSQMRSSPKEAVEILRMNNANALTDVTGFGLGGHLIEMLDGSDLCAELDLGSVPVYPGALAHAESGIASTLLPENLVLAINVKGTSMMRVDNAIFFDPQTAGGMIASLPALNAKNAINKLHKSGYTSASLIGYVREKGFGDPYVQVFGRFGQRPRSMQMELGRPGQSTDASSLVEGT
ncbi:selenide, water dikinase SelD [uncultured Tateyamaria sp.]|uniref:selenide, water dikinase SelD n=1 Tax=uncultured Tateyamaria sp. TaxID=455651 RepID=UPI0026335ABC|nr:selenide, water dikinase SelD [uncultured Tateyamaria sp.]